jgi:hypothetical protein
MKKRYGLLLVAALVLTLAIGCTALGLGTNESSPPFDWVETHRSITPECNWGETLVVDWEINPGYYTFQVMGLSGPYDTAAAFPEGLCVGAPGVTCAYTKTYAGQPGVAWGKVELGAEAGVVNLSGKCQG